MRRPASTIGFNRSAPTALESRPVIDSQAESPAARATAAPDTGAELSIVLPFFNEVESAGWVLREVRSLYPAAEVIAVDDGSSDGTWEQLRSAGIVALRLAENRGQSAALWTGLQRATRPVCALLDGDGQNDPADISRMVAALGDADVVCGYRQERRDSWKKRAASRFANFVRRLLLKDGARDTGCSLKVFPRRHVGVLVPFDGLHRFLPALFQRAGLRIVEIPVNHRARRFGRSKYGNLSRAFRGLYDLVGVSWLLHRQIRFPEIEAGDE